MKAKHMNQRDKFLKRLQSQVYRFNIESAMDLTSQIHEAERLGYELSKKEDKLWEELTDLIERHTDKTDRKFDSFD